MYFIEDLRRSGASPAEIRQMRRDSQKVRHGAYAAGEVGRWELFDLRCEATLRRLRDGAMLAGPAAARQLGLPLVGDPPATVHVRGVTRGSYGSGVRVVSGGHPDPAGIATAVAWTVADCARLLSRRDALIVADAALHLRLCTREELAAVVDALAGATGVSRVRWIADHADPKSESPGETWTRMIVTDLGYSVSSQHSVEVEGHRHRIDLLLDGTMVGLEFDGRVKYDGRDPEEVEAAVVKEKRRQGRMEAIGYRLLRVIWEQCCVPQTLDRRIQFAVNGAVTPRSQGRLAPPW